MKHPRTLSGFRLPRGLAMSFLALSLAAQEPLRKLDHFWLAHLQGQERNRVALAERRLQDHFPLLGLTPDYSLKLRTAETDAFGHTHSRFTQFYKGVKVWGGEVISHLTDRGEDRPETSALETGIALNVEPSMNPSEALAIALESLAPKGHFAYPPEVEIVIYPNRQPVVERKFSQSHQPLNALDVVQRTLGHRLAFHVHIELENDQDPLTHMDFLIDAHSGEVLQKWSTLHTTAAVGNGRTQYSGNVRLDTNNTGSVFELRDLTRGTLPHPRTGLVGNYTTNADNGTASPGQNYTDADNTWGDSAPYLGTSGSSENGQTAAADAHYGLQSTWDFYRSVLGRNGIDGKGTSVYSRVHYGVGYANAFWSDSCFCMTFGDEPMSGASAGFSWAELDVAAHEMTHGVSVNAAGFLNLSENHGLSESFSDIFGTMVEFYTRGGGTGNTIPNAAPGANWTIGEQIYAGSPFRWLYKPSKDGTSVDAWSPMLIAMEGHDAAGPLNRCFYFLSQGAASVSGDTYSSYLPVGMTGIGNDKAARIFYRALTAYLTAISDYADMRAAALQAARDLYGESSTEVAAVKNAFAAVNVGPPASNPDQQPPVLINPSVAGTSGTVTLAVNPSDNAGITSVEYWLDLVRYATVRTAPWSYALNSTAIANGAHVLTAKAFDAAGNMGTSSGIFFPTSNPAMQVLANTGFEGGRAGWSSYVFFGNTFGGIVDSLSLNPVNAHSGDFYQLLGGWTWPSTYGPQMNSHLVQLVQLPAVASSMSLDFWSWVTALNPDDSLQILVQNYQNTQRLSKFETPVMTTGYVKHSYPIPLSFLGQTVYAGVTLFQFSNVNPTAIRIDDLTLNVTGASTALPTIDSQPQSTSRLIGASATFSIAVSGGTPPYVIEWFHNGNYITAAQGSSTCTIPLLRDQDAGSYVARVFDANSSVASIPATLTVNRDVNTDGATDILDLAALARAYGATPSSSNWNILCDFNRDGVIDDADVALFMLGF